MSTTTPEFIEAEPAELLPFAQLRSVSYGSRPPGVEALDFAIGSLATAAGQSNGTPASDTAIVARADTFLDFFIRAEQRWADAVGSTED